MNIDIDKLISEMEDRKKSHRENSSKGSFQNYENCLIRENECDFLIQKLIALKNEQPEAITEDSHFRKHEVGRSAASDDISTKGNVPGESSSETQIVGQNEQIKKVYCQVCGWELGSAEHIEFCHRRKMMLGQ